MPQLHHPRTRDVALQRLKSLNRWLIAGSAALTGVLTAVAANAFPGHTLKSHTTATGARSAKGGSATGGQTGSTHLRGPSRAPESSEESGTGATESSSGAEARSEPQVEAEKPVETEKPVEAEKSTEPEKPVEAEKPVETKTEAPVVSGGS